MSNERVCTTAADGVGEDPGCVQDWLQELSEQHREEAGSPCYGKPVLWTQDGSGQRCGVTLPLSADRTGHTVYS